MLPREPPNIAHFFLPTPNAISTKESRRTCLCGHTNEREASQSHPAGKGLDLALATITFGPSGRHLATYSASSTSYSQKNFRGMSGR